MSYEPNARYPDPAIEVLDPSFLKYRLFNASVEQLASGTRWGEGPVWFGDGRYLLWSDLPNDRIMRWDEATGTASVFRHPSNKANGNTRDRNGRLVTCEHGGRRVTRTEYDGSISVLMDNWEGKHLNSPNDVVCKSDGSIWFTDPPFGLISHYEGTVTEPEIPARIYRIDADGTPARATREIIIRTAAATWIGRRIGQPVNPAHRRLQRRNAPPAPIPCTRTISGTIQSFTGAISIVAISGDAPRIALAVGINLSPYIDRQIRADDIDAVGHLRRIIKSRRKCYQAPVSYRHA